MLAWLGSGIAVVILVVLAVGGYLVRTMHTVLQAMDDNR